jgi:hypothetical protein
VTHFWDDELTPALLRTLRVIVEKGPLGTRALRAAGGGNADTAAKLEAAGLVTFQLAQPGQPGVWSATEKGRERARHGRYGDKEAHKAILAARRAQPPPRASEPVVRPYGAPRAPQAARKSAPRAGAPVRGVGGLRPTLNEIADRITAHLRRFERDPAINTERGVERAGFEPSALKPYYMPGAWRSGARVRVKYLGYRDGTPLSREEAEAYLAGLDKGFVGRHFEFASTPKPSNRSADGQDRPRRQKPR